MDLYIELLIQLPVVILENTFPCRLHLEIMPVPSRLNDILTILSLREEQLFPGLGVLVVAPSIPEKKLILHIVAVLTFQTQRYVQWNSHFYHSHLPLPLTIYLNVPKGRNAAWVTVASTMGFERTRLRTEITSPIPVCQYACLPV